MAAQKAYLMFFLLNVLFFLFLFCLFFFFDVLFAVASLDLKVPMFPGNQEEVMFFDVLT